MIEFKHHYGKTKFKEHINKNGKSWTLAEAFPNFGVDAMTGHKTAMNYADYMREQGFYAIVVAKVNASAIYIRKR